MIYVEDTVVLYPGKMSAYEEHARELATILAAAGIKCIGSWTAASGNMAERTGLWACEDFAEFQTAIAAAVASKEGAAWIQKTLPMQVSHTRRILRPTPSSPLQ
jgi:hypothetical protein